MMKDLTKAQYHFLVYGLEEYYKRVNNTNNSSGLGNVAQDREAIRAASRVRKGGY